jgi:hypothetical protein
MFNAKDKRFTLMYRNKNLQIPVAEAQKISVVSDEDQFYFF